MGCHPTAESGQVGDQHEEVCGYIWIFHTLLRSLKLSVKLLKCMANMFLFLILILSLVLWGSAVLNAPSNKGEYQLNSDKTRVDSTTTGHFGTFLFVATHTFSCVVHSMNSRCLKAVPRCEGDKSTIKMI